MHTRRKFFIMAIVDALINVFYCDILSYEFATIGNTLRAAAFLLCVFSLMAAFSNPERYGELSLYLTDHVIFVV